MTMVGDIKHQRREPKIIGKYWVDLVGGDTTNGLTQVDKDKKKDVNVQQ